MILSANRIRGTSSRGVSSRRYVDTWRVTSDGVIDHPTLAEPAVPVSIGTAFTYDGSAVCRSIDADYENIDESRSVVLVTVNYETGTGGNEDPENEDPTQDHPDVSWGSRIVRLPVRFTNADPPVAIANSAGQPFDPLPEEEFRVLIYEFAHNITTYNEANASSYRGAINSDAFTLAGLALEPYQARIASIRAVNQERGGIRYWRESVVVEIVDDWRLTLVDEGVLKRSAVADGPGDDVYLGEGNFGKLSPVLDANGLPIVEPILLDGNGAPLGAGDPVLLTFQTAAKPERPFAALGLPTTNNP